ncbi:hypothetical protein ACP70R_024182 [Stipagrostis hirtigluma subsp. patula]
MPHSTAARVRHPATARRRTPNRPSASLLLAPRPHLARSIAPVKQKQAGRTRPELEAAVGWASRAAARHGFSVLAASSPWMAHLAAVACVALAAKVEETEVLEPYDLQVLVADAVLFELKTVRRMEQLVLSAELLALVNTSEDEVAKCARIMAFIAGDGGASSGGNKRKHAAARMYSPPLSPSGVIGAVSCFSWRARPAAWRDGARALESRLVACGEAHAETGGTES